MGAESGFNPLSAIGMGVGLIGSIGNIFGNAKANRELRALRDQDPTYKANPIAAQRLALAQTLLSARMPGSAAVERNIYGNAANSLSQINRNATDSSEALALGAGVQGQANDAFNKLGLAEANDYQRRYGNYVGAQEGQINEDDKVFNDETRRYQDKLQIGGAINANRQNTWSSIANLGFGAAQLGMSGGFGGGSSSYSPPRGLGSQGFNSNGYATGVPIMANAGMPSAGSLGQFSAPSYTGWQGAPYPYGGH